MSTPVAALIVGTALALGGLAFVLFPIFADGTSWPERDVPGVSPADFERAIDALRVIEFDHATGKLTDPDYTALKAAFTADAIWAMRSAGAGPVPDDQVEAMIGRYRQELLVCPQCGEQREPAARFCSSCGHRVG